MDFCFMDFVITKLSIDKQATAQLDFKLVYSQDTDKMDLGRPKLMENLAPLRTQYKNKKW